MKIDKKFIRCETESLSDIEEYLQGKVFHITLLAYLPSIIKCGEIKTNFDGVLPTTFGGYNSFFRIRNCVSLFDYRPEPTIEIKEFRYRCYPFQPARTPNGGIAILFLKPRVYDVLVPWTLRNEEKAFNEQIVPHVETGYPGTIPIDHIKEIISVEITEGSD